MKRKRDGARAASRPASPQRPARRPARWTAGALVGVVVAIAAGVWVTHPKPAPGDRATRERRIDDSLVAAVKAQNAERMLYWLARRRELDPHDPRRTIDYALQLHDLVWAGSGGPRQYYRTSLQRVETDLRVIAMLDSAGQAVTTARGGAHVQDLLGSEFYDYGLTTDALILLLSAFNKVRDDTTLNGHVGTALTSLRDPMSTSDSTLEP